MSVKSPVTMAMAVKKPISKPRKRVGQNRIQDVVNRVAGMILKCESESTTMTASSNINNLLITHLKQFVNGLSTDCTKMGYNFEEVLESAYSKAHTDRENRSALAIKRSSKKSEPSAF